MSSSSLKVPVMVGVVLVSVAAIAYVFLGQAPTTTKASAGKASKPEEVDGDSEVESRNEAAEDSPIPKATLIKVFQQITAQMERVILRISQLEQSLLQRAQQEGQEVDQQELRESMMKEFNDAMKEVETRVYEHMSVSEEDVEAATAYFNSDADFQNVLKTLRRKYSLFTGQGVEDVPDHVTMQLVMDVMSETMTKMTAAMEEVFAQTKQELTVGTEAFAQTLQQRYVERIAVLRQKVQQKYGIDQDLLQAGVIKYQNNPEFQKKMVELTNEQSEAYKKLGLA